MDSAALRRFAAEANELASAVADLADLVRGARASQLAAADASLGDEFSSAANLIDADCSVSAERAELLIEALSRELSNAERVADADRVVLARLHGQIADQAAAVSEARLKAARGEADCAAFTAIWLDALGNQNVLERLGALSKESEACAAAPECEATAAETPAAHWDALDAADSAKQLAAAELERIESAGPKWHHTPDAPGYKLLVKGIPKTWDDAAIGAWISCLEHRPKATQCLSVGDPPRRRFAVLTYTDQELALDAKRRLNGRAFSATSSACRTQWVPVIARPPQAPG